MLPSRFFSRRMKFSLVLSVFCLWLASSNVTAQDQPNEPRAELPVVSDEAFEAIKHFYGYDRNIPLDAQITAKDNYASGKREKIIFTGVNSRVPAYLVTPKEGDGPWPVILLVDGIFGSKDRWFEDNSWPRGGLVTKALLEAGFAVWSSDAALHGERTHENNYYGPRWPLSYPNASRHMIIQTAQEYRRVLDYLETRDEINSDKIGMMGLSMGGMITFQVTSVDPRIKSAAAGVTPMFSGPEFRATSPIAFSSRIKSDSFLMFMGNQDNFYTMQEAKELLDRVPARDKELVEFNAGHRPPADYITLVRDWFVRTLKPTGKE